MKPIVALKAFPLLSKPIKDLREEDYDVLGTSVGVSGTLIGALAGLLVDHIDGKVQDLVADERLGLVAQELSSLRDSSQEVEPVFRLIQCPHCKGLFKE